MTATLIRPFCPALFFDVDVGPADPSITPLVGTKFCSVRATVPPAVVVGVEPGVAAHDNDVDSQRDSNTCCVSGFGSESLLVEYPGHHAS